MNPTHHTPAELTAWLGGWLCSDGTITLTKQSLNIEWTLTDLDVLEDMADALETLIDHRPSVNGPYGPYGSRKGQPLYRIGIKGAKAEELTELLRPYLSQRYARRLDERLAQVRPRTGPAHKLSAEDVADIKQRLAVGSHGVGSQLAREYGVSHRTISGIKHGAR